MTDRWRNSEAHQIRLLAVDHYIHGKRKAAVDDIIVTKSSDGITERAPADPEYGGLQSVIT
jgi:hypothetical protein